LEKMEAGEGGPFGAVSYTMIRERIVRRFLKLVQKACFGVSLSAVAFSTFSVVGAEFVVRKCFPADAVITTASQNPVDAEGGGNQAFGNSICDLTVDVGKGNPGPSGSTILPTTRA
jgi:hypothetical protein